jgi:cytochrome P450
MAIEYDPLDPVQVDDHQSVLARLRHEAPVSELKPGFFYLARHQDVMDVCRAPQVFRQGRHIPRHLDTRSEDQLNLGETDPPEHVRVRKVLSALLTPSKVRAMEPLIRKTCETLVDRFADRGRADIIADLAAPMPVGVIGSFSGMPEEYQARFTAYSEAFMLRTDSDAEKVEAAKAVVAEFDAAAREVIRQRQGSTHRPDDVLTGLIESLDADGKPLSEDKILTHMTKDVIVGGTETTKHLIGNLFYNLCATPGAYERVRADRSLVPAAIEETLRLDGPAQIMFRVPTVDVEIRGCPIPAGATVAVGYASANRDEDVFENSRRLQARAPGFQGQAPFWVRPRDSPLRRRESRAARDRLRLECGARPCGANGPRARVSIPAREVLRHARSAELGRAFRACTSIGRGRGTARCGAVNAQAAIKLTFSRCARYAV